MPHIEAQRNPIAPVPRSANSGRAPDYVPSVSAAEIDAVFGEHLPPFATRTDGSATQEVFVQWLKTCGLDALAQALPLFVDDGSRRKRATSNAPVKQSA